MQVQLSKNTIIQYIAHQNNQLLIQYILQNSIHIFIINQTLSIIDSIICYKLIKSSLKTKIDMFFTIPVVIALLLAVIACLLILQPQTLSKTSLQDKIMRNEFKSSKHKWQRSQQKSFYFCYLCGKLTNGWFSDVLECKKCGIIIHKICKFTKLRKPDCKYIVAKNNATRFYHQWRQCNYTANTCCSVCTQVCSGLQNYICLWCNRMRHGLCNGEGIECDFGPLRTFILEPTQIKCSSINFTTNAFRSLKRIQHSMRDRVSGSDDNDSQQENKIAIRCDTSKHVVVVLINKKSGGQIGNNFIKAFYRILNPLQVISILDEGLQKLKLFTEIPNLFLLIAGGDGTVCSVINYVKTIPQWKNNSPPAAVIPLGTGNDLSRTLGWGGSIQEISPVELLLDYYRTGKNELMDRWKLTVVSGEQQREFTIYNYMGIGLDAKICKDFHDIREKYPQLFFSQFSNKLIYTQIGTIDIFKNSGRIRLADYFTIHIDGHLANIDDFENIIFLNINNWGGGVTGLWKASPQKGFHNDSFSDGIIQIIGLTDVVHMGQVQIGMDEPFQIGQGKVIKLKSKVQNKIIPLQIDGQPLQLITPFEILLERKDQINVLATTPTDSGRMINFLKLALMQGIINEQQLESLLALSKKYAAK